MPTHKEVNALDKITQSSEGAPAHYRGLGLTAKQERFANEFLLNGGNSMAAAKRAGYANPGETGWVLKNNPKVAEAIRRMIRAEIDTKGTRLAWSIYEKALTDESVGFSYQFKAATKVLDYAYSKEAQQRQEKEKKPGGDIADMTIEELERVVREGKSALHTLNNAVDVTPNAAAEPVLTDAPVSTADSSSSGEGAEGPSDSEEPAT